MATLDPSLANTVDSLNANFKQVYADKIKDLVPTHVKLLNLVDFAKADKQQGGAFNEPVITGLEAGFTYGGSEGLAFTLNQVASFPMKNAQVKGHEIVLRSALSVGAVSRSLSSKNAFERSTKLLVGNMLKSMHHRLEIAMMYGQQGLGTVNGVSGQVITIDTHEWAPGIWMGIGKAAIDIFDATLATKRNAGEVRISSASLTGKSITVTGSLAGVVATDVIFFQGAYDESSSEYLEAIGIHKIATTVGTLFGIANTNEPLFQGNTVDVGTDATSGAAVLSFAKIEDAIASTVEKGLGEEEMTILVNPRSWKNLLTEQTAKRRYDSSYSSSEMEDGAKALKFYGQNGAIKIISSTFVKEGYAYAFCEKELVRVGSTDVTFNRPGKEGEFFKELDNANGYELRCYSDQALFTSRPSCITVLRYIKS